MARALEAVADPQGSLEEKLIEDPVLLELLSERRRLNGIKSEATKNAKDADEKAKAKLAELDLDDGDVIRVGDFLVTKRAVAGREVSFTSGARSQLSIRFTGLEQ